MFGRLGWAEILIIVVLLVILFGSAKIPGMMRNLANGINVFKKEMKKDTDKKEPVNTIVKPVKKSKPVAKKSGAKKPARLIKKK